MPGAAVAAVSLGAGIFGASKDRSAARDATQANVDQRERSEAFIREQSEKARGDVLTLQPGVEASRLAGFGGALDVFKQALPQQLQAFQQGNLRAQDIQKAGLSQQQRAILGQQLFDPLDFRPQGVGLPDFSNIQLPQFTGSQELLQAQQPQQQQPQFNRFRGF